MPSREEMIQALRRQQMIDEIRAAGSSPEPDTKAENSHDLIPFIKDTVKGVAQGVRTVGAGVAHAATNPAETAKKAGDWVMDVATDPVGDLKGVYRTVRSIPLVGDAADDAVGGLYANTKRLGNVVDRLSGKEGPSGAEVYDKALQDYKTSMAAEDAKHAQESPVANAAQKLAGIANPLGMSVPANVMDTFVKSIKAGNNFEDAMKDARNALVLMKGPELAAKGVSKVVSKIPAAVTGVSDDTAKYYMQNVDAVDNARPLKDVSDDLSQATKQFRRDMSNQSTEGFNVLKDSGVSATASQLAQPIDDQLTKLGANAVTGPAKANVSELSALRGSIEEVAKASDNTIGAIGLDKVKSFVKQIDDMIDYEAVDRGRASSRDKALLAIRRKYDDMLKGSDEYKGVMDGLSTKASALEDVAGSLKTDKSTDNFLARLARNKDPRGAEALQTLDDQMGTNFGKEVKDAGTKDFFTRENSRGTRNTMVSGAVGALTGSLIGVPPWISGAIGMTAGPVVDKFGRQAYQSVLRAAAKNPKLIERYSKTINAAAKAGPASLIALHQMLKKQDAEYAAATGDGE